MNKKPIRFLAIAALIGGVIWFFGRRRLPASFDGLTSAQQREYLAMLDRADAWSIAHAGLSIE